MHRLRRLRGGLSERVGHAFHRGKSFASRFFAAGRAGTNVAGDKNGAANGRRRFRQLHEHLRMRSSVPGGNQRQFHRQTQSRIRASRFAEKRGRIRIIVAAN